MDDLVHDLRRVPTPALLRSRFDLVNAVKSTQVRLLRAAIGRRAPELDSSVLASLRRYALWLETIALREEESEESELALAATLYEFCGSATLELGPPDIFRPPVNDLLRCSILSSLGMYGAQSTLIGRRAAKILAGLKSRSAVERCHAGAASAVAALLGRDMVSALGHSQEMEVELSAALTEIEDRHSIHSDLFALDRAVALARATGKAAAGMLVGIPALVEASAQDLKELSQVAGEEDEANWYWIADRLQRVVERMHRSSVASVLDSHRELREFRSMLIREPVYELWGPQLEAVAKGLLDPTVTKHFVISMPTGAGKTLVAELAIASALLANRDGWALYVTPSRALVSQVSVDLRKRLGKCGIRIRTVVAGAEQSVTLGEEIDLLQTRNTVTITTPEKLDAYYRNARQIFDSCKLAVFDEVHKIGESSRGALIESLITRILVQQPGMRILLLSGVMTNAAELAEWLGADRTEVITTRRRPVRQVQGVALRQSTLQVEEPRRLKAGVFRKVSFSGAVILVHEAEELQGKFEVSLPNVFKGHFNERDWGLGGWREDRSADHSSVNDHAMELAERMQPLPGTILVFVETQAAAEKCAREFNSSDDSHRDERARLAAFLAAELGPEHGLVASCLHGVAYHHSRLPTVVQRAIEMGLQEEWIKAVFATPTLREGLNTSATTVIVAGHKYWSETEAHLVDIAEMDYLNMAGRAGRPYVDTEGRVILVPEYLAAASAAESGKKYILVGDNALRVRSQLRELADWLNRHDPRMDNLKPDQQALILSLQAAGLGDADGVSTFVNHSLWNCQEDDETVISRAIGKATETLAAAVADIGQERLDLASRLGLSLTSAEALRGQLLAAVRLFDAAEADNVLGDDQVKALLDASLEIPEARHGDLNKAVPSTAHYLPLLAWLGGQSYQTILETAKGSGALPQSRGVASAVEYASDFSTWLSWAFGAAYTILQAVLPEVDPRVGLLPLRVRYGVSSAIAAYLSLLGVSDRTAAHILADRYKETGRPDTLDAVSEWLSGIEPTLDEIFPRDQHHLRAELLRRQIFTIAGTPPTHIFARFEATERTSVGTLLSLRVAYPSVSVLRDGRVIGSLVEASEVLRLARGSARGISAIVASTTGTSGVVAVVRWPGPILSS